MKLIQSLILIFAVFQSSVEAEKKVVCFISSWAHSRPAPGSFSMEKIDPFLCSHYVYLFATLDMGDTAVKPLDESLDIDRNFYSDFTKITEQNPAAKVLIGLGAFTKNELASYSSLVSSSEENLQKFATSVVDFCYQHSFHGVDVNIENFASSVSKSGVSKFLQVLSAALDKHNFILTASISGRKKTIDTFYDIQSLNRYLDFVNVMTVDFHGPWEGVVHHHAPLLKRPSQTNSSFNADFVLNYLSKLGVPRENINMGIPTYGRSYQIPNKDSEEYEPGMTSTGPGSAGLYTQEAGFLSHYEICLLQADLKPVGDPDGHIGPYAFHKNLWVSYDDDAMVSRKAAYVVNKKYGGVAFWDKTSDDFNGICGRGKYPLINAAKKIFAQDLDSFVADKTSGFKIPLIDDSDDDPAPAQNKNPGTKKDFKLAQVAESEDPDAGEPSESAKPAKNLNTKKVSRPKTAKKPLVEDSETGDLPKGFRFEDFDIDSLKEGSKLDKTLEGSTKEDNFGSKLEKEILASSRVNFKDDNDKLEIKDRFLARSKFIDEDDSPQPRNSTVVPPLTVETTNPPSEN